MIFCNVYHYTFQIIPHTFGHLDWSRPTPVADGLCAHWPSACLRAVVYIHAMVIIIIIIIYVERSLTILPWSKYIIAFKNVCIYVCMRIGRVHVSDAHRPTIHC